jgi:hypothetical protein
LAAIRGRKQCIGVQWNSGELNTRRHQVLNNLIIGSRNLLIKYFTIQQFEYIYNFYKIANSVNNVTNLYSRIYKPYIKINCLIILQNLIYVSQQNRYQFFCFQGLNLT